MTARNHNVTQATSMEAIDYKTQPFETECISRDANLKSVNNIRNRPKSTLSGRTEPRQTATSHPHPARGDAVKPETKKSYGLIDQPHPRKCELCAKIFLWKHDLKLVAADLHFRCPACLKNPPVATDTITSTPSFTRFEKKTELRGIPVRALRNR